MLAVVADFGGKEGVLAASEQDADLEHTGTDFSVTTGNKQEKDAQPD